MTLDVLFRSIGQNIRRVEHPELPSDNELVPSLQACDQSEAQILSATNFLESIYGDVDRYRPSRAQTPMHGVGSRAQTPMMVCSPEKALPGSFPTSPPVKERIWHSLYPKLPYVDRESGLSFVPVRLLPKPQHRSPKKESVLPSQLPFWNRSLTFGKTFTKSKIVKESMAPPSAPRRHLPARPSALPQIPDVSNYAFDVDRRSDYVVLISMYEVYNDRIFDLLSSPMQFNTGQMTTRQGAVLQKTLSRRPLLFKSTEMSPDRKVVAGLRKVLCGSYDEAMMVLETGLIERRVAGTGSNSVSSRSHGFFCIEVKQSQQSSDYGPNDWSGGTLSIVDLAGSERARNAKTTGSTLAEAGKINESLMYLGQCLQVQSDCQQDGSKPIVPFRQCKLTELLFSNSFPSTTSQHTTYRTPQRAIMIVTADPRGDFNATSQILRYSALAREVTVPRIPSVTSTILNGTTNNKQTTGGRSSPHAFSAEELEQAANEIARLSEECDQMAMRLAEEEIRRTECNLKLQAAEERATLVEQEIREECWAQMEARMEEEKQRWRIAWEEEREKSERYLDGKIEILEKGATFMVHEDASLDGFARVEEVERDNEQLRARIEALERELHQRSPSKKSKSKQPRVLQENSNPNPTTNPFLASLRASLGDGGLVAPDLGKLSLKEVSPRKASLRGASIQAQEDAISPKEVSVPKMPTTLKKQRKLTTRKWDLGEVGSDGEF
jgi:Kinesin motor domain